jgi:hypothetical protein
MKMEEPGWYESFTVAHQRRLSPRLGILLHSTIFFDMLLEMTNSGSRGLQSIKESLRFLSIPFMSQKLGVRAGLKLTLTPT